MPKSINLSLKFEASMTLISPYLLPSKISKDASFPAPAEPAHRSHQARHGFGFLYTLYIFLRVADGYALSGRQDKVSVGFFLVGISFPCFIVAVRYPILLPLLSVYPVERCSGRFLAVCHDRSPLNGHQRQQQPP